MKMIRELTNLTNEQIDFLKKEEIIGDDNIKSYIDGIVPDCDNINKDIVFYIFWVKFEEFCKVKKIKLPTNVNLNIYTMSNIIQLVLIRYYNNNFKELLEDFKKTLSFFSNPDNLIFILYLFYFYNENYLLKRKEERKKLLNMKSKKLDIKKEIKNIKQETIFNIKNIILKYQAYVVVKKDREHLFGRKAKKRKFLKDIPAKKGMFVIEIENELNKYNKSLKTLKKLDLSNSKLSQKGVGVVSTLSTIAMIDVSGTIAAILGGLTLLYLFWNSKKELCKILNEINNVEQEVIKELR